MLDLDRHIEPGERVVWRTRRLRGEVVTAISWAAGLGVVCVAWRVLTDDDAAFVLAAAIGLIYYTHWGRRPAEAWVTGRRLLFVRGVLRPRISAFDRADIARAELFDGDDTLVLHGANGELYRATLLDAPDELLRELGVPVAFWTDRTEAHLSNFTVLAFILVPLLAALALVAAFVGTLVLGKTESIRSAIRGISGYFGPWYGIPASATVLIVMAIGAIFGLAGIALLRRMVMKPAEIISFRRAVRYPRWSGFDPRSPIYMTWPYRLYRSVRLAFDRVLYGRPPDEGDLQPAIIAPGNLDDFRN